MKIARRVRRSVSLPDDPLGVQREHGYGHTECDGLRGRAEIPGLGGAHTGMTSNCFGYEHNTSFLWLNFAPAHPPHAASEHPRSVPRLRKKVPGVGPVYAEE